MKKDKNELPLFKKFFVVLIIIISCLINSTTFAFTLSKENLTENITYEILEEVKSQETELEKLINNYSKELEKQGYKINKININENTLSKDLRKYPKKNINDLIINNLDVYICCIQLTVKDNQIYYFKSQEECNNFIEKINVYYNQSYSTVDNIINLKDLTSNSILENKVLELKQKKEKEKLEEEQKRKNYNDISSRSTISARNTSAVTSSNVPIASYTYISSYYGMRKGYMHTGVDFAAPANTYIYAWKEGIVTSATWSGGYGNFIIITHNDGTVSRYAHCNSFAVSAGQCVSKGQLIGYVGSTGNSTGNHLHFEIKINNNFVNPLNYL